MTFFSDLMSLGLFWAGIALLLLLAFAMRTR